MSSLIRNFEWGTLEGGFAAVDGAFRETHPRYSRGGATFVSSHGAIVTSDYSLPYDAPLRLLAPAQLADRMEARHLPADMALASQAQFAMADLEHERYEPFAEQSGLFRTFAGLRSEADIVAFANRFGPLGADLSVAIVDDVPEGEPWMKGVALYWAEPIEQWLAEAQEMARAISLWELIRAENKSAFLAKLTRSSARLRIKTQRSDTNHIAKDWVLVKKAENPAMFQAVSEADEKAWPQLLLKQWVDRGARGRTDFGVSGNDLKATFTPNGLIGALWLQMSLAIDGHVDFLQCRECSDWFGISAEEARPEKRYCSNACRMRAYRKRKKDRKVSREAKNKS